MIDKQYHAVYGTIFADDLVRSHDFYNSDWILVNKSCFRILANQTCAQNQSPRDVL